MSSAPAYLTQVLLAEDEIAIAFELEEALREAGYGVIGPALNASEAAAMAAGRPLDAAVIDFGLAQHDPHGVLWSLVATGTPIVLLTGYEAPDLPDWLPSAEVCLKPCSMEELLDKLGTALTARQAMAGPNHSAAA